MVMSYFSLAAVQGVKVSEVNLTAANISWEIQVTDIPIVYYTVVYSEKTQANSSESQPTKFNSSTMSGIITNLDEATVYHFWTFATYRVDGRMLDGETSVVVNYSCKWYKILKSSLVNKGYFLPTEAALVAQ